MAMTSFFSKATLLLLVTVFSFSVNAASSSSCFKKNTSSIPSDHLMYKKTKPLVIGHRGNPKEYQENTLEGFESLLKTNADGFGVDIYLTKDNKLVAFHDDNAKRLTGQNRNIWNMTADELTKLTIKDSLEYGPNTYKFKTRPHIPLLKTVLEAMKDSGKLMSLQIKPNGPISSAASSKVGRLVAKMVTDLELVNQAVITSFDPIKLRAAHQQNPNIPTGPIYRASYWDQNKCNKLRGALKSVPEAKDCPFMNLQDCNSFMKAVFESGDVLKAVNASFVSMNYTIYDNSKYSNNTMDTLRKNYNPKISAGAWIIYNMALKNDSLEAKNEDTKIDELKNIGVQQLITDDVYRLLRKLGRPVSVPTSSAARKTLHKMYFVMMFFVLSIYGAFHF